MKKGKRRRSRAGRSVRHRPPAGAHDEDRGPSREKILRGRKNEGAVPETPSRSETEADVRAGRVIAIRAAEALVEPEGRDEPVACILRKSTRTADPGANVLVVGDRVRWVAEGDPPYVLAEVLPRRTRLARARRGGEQVLCANVDLGVIVASADQPPFKPRLVDRYLVSVGHGGLEPVIVLNKSDLVDGDEAQRLLAPYRPLGLPVVPTSTVTGQGIPELIDILRDRTAVFSGQSGVGKSSLLNRLAPDLSIATAEVYGRAGKGRHTTSASTLYRFPFGGSVVDTPGIRSFALTSIPVEVLGRFFPEVIRAARDCRYADCAHAGEDGCALPHAIEAGGVLRDRLESYSVLRAEATAR